MTFDIRCVIDRVMHVVIVAIRFCRLHFAVGVQQMAKNASGRQPYRYFYVTDLCTNHIAV